MVREWKLLKFCEPMFTEQIKHFDSYGWTIHTDSLFTYSDSFGELCYGILISKE